MTHMIPRIRAVTLTTLCLIGGTLCLIGGLFIGPAQANPIVADLSKDHISIRSNFSGEKLLLFGAVSDTANGPIEDVIVVLRGPDERFTIRKKSKKMGIWVNDAAYDVGPLPGFYVVASSRPLDDIAAAAQLRAHGIGAQFLNISFNPQRIDDAARNDAIAGFIRLKTANQLYAEEIGGVKIMSDRLFRVEINLPSGMPVGDYRTEFFAFQKGRVVGYQAGKLPVDIVGAGHILNKAAYETPLIYGLSGVFMAFLMGWGVAVLFRRR